jgi:hypothetical protein
MTDVQKRQYEMGYTAAEFSRVLQGNFSGEKSPFKCSALSPESWQITQHDTDVDIHIEIENKPARVLGAITLPVLQVTFEMLQASPQQTINFFDKFFKYFHKGGG